MYFDEIQLAEVSQFQFILLKDMFDIEWHTISDVYIIRFVCFFTHIQNAACEIIVKPAWTIIQADRMNHQVK